MKKLLLPLSLIVFLASVGYGEQTKRVLILPFQLLGFQQMSYLRGAMVNMMASRMGLTGRFEILDESRVLKSLERVELGTIDGERAAAAGRLVGADFVVVGGLTKLGNKISLDAKALEVKTGRVVARAFSATQSLEDVIVKVEVLADQISAGILGPVAVRKVAPESSPQKPRATPGAPDPKLAELVTKLIDERLANLTPAAPDPKPDKPVRRSDSERGEVKFNTPSEGPVSLASAKESERVRPIKFFKEGERAYGKPDWQSRTFLHRLMDVAVGDVTGDGKVELLVLLDDQLRVYMWQGRGFNQLLHVLNAEDVTRIFYSLDVADINGNGVEEVFVTSLSSQGPSLSSFVLEYKNDKFIKTWTDVDLYLRVMDVGAGKRMLLSQERGSASPFYGPVHKMIWRRGRYVDGGSLSLPEKANIYNFVRVDLNGSGTAKTVLMSEDGEIYLYDASERKLTNRDGVYYGKHERYIEYAEVEVNVVGEENIKRLTHHGRLPLGDMDGNGRLEIVTVRNDYSLIDTLLPALTNYENKAAAVGLEWNGSIFEERWETRNIQGSVINLALADVDGDGREELLVGVMKSIEGLAGLAQVGHSVFTQKSRFESRVYLYRF